MILEVALKQALLSLKAVVTEKNQQMLDCEACVICLFDNCGKKNKQCVPNVIPKSEPSCDLLLQAQLIPDDTERKWALTTACLYYQQFCPEKGWVTEGCRNAMRDQCKLKLNKCKSDGSNNMNHPNTASGTTNADICGQRWSASSEMALRGKIMGGSRASPGAWPWLVSIKLHGELMCGGVLLDKLWVLTAAHCFSGNRNELYWQVVAGEYNLSRTDAAAKVLQVNRIITHPKFNPQTFNNDIALLELTAPVLLSSSIHPICLPVNSKEPPYGTSCDIVGWGSLYEDGPFADVLMEAKIPLLNVNSCSILLGKELITNTMFCAGYMSGGIDSCQGDSGGPLTCQNHETQQHFLYGITSWGNGCGQQRKPGVYTKVTAFTDWITQQMKQSPRSREPTCFELLKANGLRKENEQKKELSLLCSFYTNSCFESVLGSSVCAHIAEKKCRLKQNKCELQTFLQNLLDIMRHAEEFIQKKINLYFFTETFQKYMEEVYKSIFLSPSLLLTHKEQLPAPEREQIQPSKQVTTVSSSTTAASMENSNMSIIKDTGSLFQEVGPQVAEWIEKLNMVQDSFSTEEMPSIRDKNISNKSQMGNEQHLFLQDFSETTVKQVNEQLNPQVKELRSEVHISQLMKAVTSSSVDKGNATEPPSSSCQDLNKVISSKVESVMQSWAWILRIPGNDLSMKFLEVLVDTGSKNRKGLCKARIEATVGGKAITFYSLVGLEEDSFYRSMPSIIALALETLKS
ncbi:serine protease 56 [Protopterus annectens]|uniref:serine protease 56 n=1 Tax=Protopterus annectens TaxID=7888 RepID=UPI001CF98977|nr:serine protease 56 [Protopterus annectens]